MEDNKIIIRCLSGHTEAFEKLMNKYQSNIISLAWSILGNKEDARDVTQEVFTQAYFNLVRFDMTRSFKNWLYSIVYKRCIDRKREKKLQSKFIGKTAKDEWTAGEHRNREMKIENSEILNQILSKLNEKERTSIILKMIEGYSAREISQVLNCAESTARVYIFNAKKKLKKIVEGEK